MKNRKSNVGASGDEGHLQIGPHGAPSYALMNTASNVYIGSTPSQPFLFRCSGLVTGIVSEFDPGFCADWQVPNRLEGHFYIFYDTGLFGNVTTMPDKNFEVRGADFYIGTNSAGKCVLRATDWNHTSRMLGFHDSTERAPSARNSARMGFTLQQRTPSLQLRAGDSRPQNGITSQDTSSSF